jgi:acyl carrier protein
VSGFRKNSPTATFVKQQMADFIYLDKHGAKITPAELFQNLVDHMGRWGDALEGGFGLNVLEVMMLDVPTTKRFMNDCVSFHFDIVQCMSRQYMVSPPAFAMAAAMSGLLPNFSLVQIYPGEGKYCRILNQHLERRSFKIRFAELADLPALIELEKKAWDENMQAAPDVLKQRLDACVTGNLVIELNGKVVCALYTQRIESTEVIDREKFMQISNEHSPTGRLLQLIAIVADPDHKELQLATELRNFALHLARIDPTVDAVLGVTRCKSFRGFEGSMDDYLAYYAEGEVTDATLTFHVGSGAEVVKTVHDFRPEDTDNNGIGVLIRYNVKAPQGPKRCRSSGSLVRSASSASAMGRSSSVGSLSSKPDETSILDLVSEIMDELGCTVDHNDLSKDFFRYDGVDSLMIAEFTSRLSAHFGKPFTPILLNQYPTVKALCTYLESLGVQSP